jgi:DNA-binding HxlR family transcriptional regulator
MMLEVTLAIAAIVIATLALLTPKLKSKKKVDADDLILAITEDYSRRINKLEGRIVDLQVRLDVLESQVEKEQRQRSRAPAIQKGLGSVVMSQESKGDVTKTGEALGDFELSILRCIGEGAKTPSEVRSVVGRSREHVARALKELYERGFLDRSGGRPFIYSLSDKGRAALKSVDLSV